MTRHLRTLFLAACLGGLSPNHGYADALERAFLSPPDSARPVVWWHWINGNITREGITADLEAMRRVGVGGGIIFNVHGSAPAGPVRIMSPEWRELVQHAVTESARLGLELGFHNAPGWSSSGGTWNRPEHGMQEVVMSELSLRGPQRFDSVLPQPEGALPMAYREIALVAFRTPAGEAVKMAEFGPKFSVGGRTVDSDLQIVLASPSPEQASSILIEFAQPYRAQLLSFRLGYGIRTGQGRIEISEDGKTFRSHDTFSITPSGRVQLHSFPSVEAKSYRIVFTTVSPRPRSFAVHDLRLSPRRGVDNLAAKAYFSRAGSRDLAAHFSPAEVVAPEDLVDLSSRMDAKGRLQWDVPEGDWTLLRLGHAPTGQVANQPPDSPEGAHLVIDPLEHAIVNRPASLEGAWLESDKLNRAALEAHWDGMMGPIVKAAGPHAGRTLKTVIVDSFEIGSQNWTPGLREEFRRRRGYDPLPYFPILSGRVVKSPEITERFLWDYRRTIADLFAENYAGHFARIAERHGMRFEVEPYGNGPFDDLQYAGSAHVPLGEFWIEKGIDSVSKLAASVGHTYGRKVIGAEAFTAGSGGGNRWEIDAFGMKALGDAAFCAGINRYEIHSFVHQPWLNRSPGMTLASVGTHFNRNITWWEQSKGWMSYITRCQAVLQQGLAVADICYFPGESLPSSMYGGHLKLPSLPAGYTFDACSAEVLVERMSVKDGRVTLPDGMSYGLLVLGNTESMSLPVLRKLKALVDGGARVIGPRPVRTPGLSSYPQSESELARLAGDLWGAGRIPSASDLGATLRAIGLQPDFEAAAETGALRYLHRLIGDADVYFVSNQRPTPLDVSATFRVAGRQPEFWWPDTGRIEPAPVYLLQGGRTTVPLTLDPAGSVFVVFRHASPADHPIRLQVAGQNAHSLRAVSSGQGPVVEARANGSADFVTSKGKTWRATVADLPPAVELAGAWQVTFPSGKGAPSQVKLPALKSWSEHAEAGVRYFSGSATYTKEFDVPPGMIGGNRYLELDLGDVKNFAEVTLNGQPLGLLWKPPYRVSLGHAAKPGRNKLEIRVTNLWPNRLIGDEQLPPDADWLDTRIKSWPAWLQAGENSPTGRLTFATRRHWKKTDALLPSGLLGPVLLQPVARVPATFLP